MLVLHHHPVQEVGKFYALRLTRLQAFQEYAPPFSQANQSSAIAQVAFAVILYTIIDACLFDMSLIRR